MSIREVEHAQPLAEEQVAFILPEVLAAQAVIGEPAKPGVNSHLFGRGLLYVAVWSLQLVAGVFVSPVLAHVLGPNEFGQIASVIALHQVLTVVAVLGLDQAMVLQRAEDGNDRAARGLVAVGIAISACITLTIGVLGPLWSGFLGFGEFNSLVLASILWTAPAAGVQVMLALLLAQDRLRAFTLISALAAVGGQLFGIALLFLIDRSAATYAWGSVISQFAAMLIGVVLTRPLWRGLMDWRIATRAVRLGVPLATGVLGVLVLEAGDRFVVLRFLGPEEVGRYQVAYIMGYVIVLLLTIMGSAWTTKFAELRDESERWALSAVSRDEIYRILIPVILGITLVAPIALRVVAPPSFQPESLTIVVFLVALSAFPVAAGGASSRLLITLRRGGTLAAIAGVAAIANIALNVLLVPLLGIAGSAGATVLAFGLLAFLQLRALPAEPVLRPPSGRLIAAIVCGVLIAGLSTLLPQTVEWNITRFIGALACLPWLVVRLNLARKGPRYIGKFLRPKGGRHRLTNA